MGAGVWSVAVGGSEEGWRSGPREGEADEEGTCGWGGACGSAREDRIDAIATNSACRVPLRVRFVAFMPRPMMVPLWTKTQPTGVSSVARASSACEKGG